MSPRRCDDAAHSSLTPRLVRSEVENALGLPKNTLDVPKYREIVKRAIKDAMASVPTMRSREHCCSHITPEPRSKCKQREKEGGKRFGTKGWRKWTFVIVEVCQVKGVPRTVQSTLDYHQSCFQEVISDSDSAVEPTSSPSLSKAKLTANTDKVLYMPT